jgi:hypothetical protein
MIPREVGTAILLRRPDTCSNPVACNVRSSTPEGASECSAAIAHTPSGENARQNAYRALSALRPVRRSRSRYSGPSQSAKAMNRTQLAVRSDRKTRWLQHECVARAFTEPHYSPNINSNEIEAGADGLVCACVQGYHACLEAWLQRAAVDAQQHVAGIDATQAVAAIVIYLPTVRPGSFLRAAGQHGGKRAT